jgi:hypothetical protein
MSKKPSFMASMMGWKVDPSNNDPYNSNNNHNVPHVPYQNVVYPNVPYNNDPDALDFNNTGILEWTNDDEDHIETQEGALCGKHAINHILQEEKIVLNTDINSQFIDKTTDLGAPDNSNPKLSNIQLNLFKYCSILENTAWKRSGMSTLQAYRNLDIVNGIHVYVPPCDENYQNMTFYGVELLLQILGYETDTSHLDKERHDMRVEFWKKMIDQLNNNNLLGIIVNLDGTHFTAISKYLKDCETWQITGENFNSTIFSYIDSIGEDGAEVQCFSMTDLILHLNKRDVEAVIYVYDKAGAYASVAARRHRRIYPFAGGRHNRRRHTKHRHTKHRHSKRCRTKHHRRASKRTRKSRK